RRALRALLRVRVC
ncbi:branched-chain amino acid transport system / permease component family protein, partial [Vibrio parahaemolyticus VPTS-2010_2]